MKVNGTLHMNPVIINRISNVNLCKESLFNISGIFGYPYIKYGIPKMRHFEYPFTFPKFPKKIDDNRVRPNSHVTNQSSHYIEAVFGHP